MEIVDIHEHSVAILTWMDVENALRLVVNQIKDNSFSPTAIVAIARGGFVPAAWLSNILGIPQVDTISIRTTESNAIRSDRLATPKVTVSRLHADSERVLLVDDVTNIGTTLKYARQAIVQGGCHDVRTAVLFRDTVGIDESPLVDFAGPAIAAWTSFPWER